MRAAAAARGAAHRPVARLRHLRLGRSAVGGQAADHGVRLRRLHLPAAHGAVAHQPREEPHGRARDVRPTRWNPRDKEIGRLYSGYLQGARRTPARSTSTTCCSRRSSSSTRCRRCASATRARFRFVDGRRVPGHQPAAVPADQAAGRASTATCAWSAIPISRSTSGAAPTCKNILDFEHDFPEAVVVRARAQLPLDAGDPRRRLGGHQPEPRTARTRRCGPTRPAARRSSTYRGADELDEADFIARHPRAGSADDARSHAWRCCIAPTPSRARSRTALRQANIPYVVLGGVGFYERKEIKDALSYLQAASSTRTTTSRCAASSTCRRAASARA